MQKLFQIMLKVFFVLLSFSFALEAANWTPPVDLSVPMSTTGRIGVDANGNAVAVWQQNNGSMNFIQAAVMPYGGSWSAPQTISNFGQFATGPEIAVAANGNAVAVWYAMVSGTLRIQSASLPFGGAWSAVENISPELLTAEFPRIAIDPVGNAVAAWRQSDGANSVAYVAQYSFSLGWTPSFAVSATGQNLFGPPAVAVGANGDAVVAWIRPDGVNNIAQASTSVGGIWPPPGGINLSDPGRDALNISVAAAPSGYAVASWDSTDGVITRIEAATQTSANVWTAAQVISTPAVDSSAPQVAVDQNGNAIVVWNENGPLKSSSLLFGSLVWGPIQEAIANGFSHKVAVDAAGNAIMSFTINDGVNLLIQAVMHPFGGNWGAPDTLSSLGDDAVSSRLGVATTPLGYTVVLWENQTVQIIQAVNLIISPTPPPDPSAPLPPADFVGRVRKNKFLNGTELLLRATWQGSPSTDVVFYRIYKNGVVVTTVSASFPLVFTTDVSSRGKARQYEVAAVNVGGFESNRIPIRILNE